ncbi:DUF5696 domain-containing protein [Natronospora cellulosivora (SeqCode)]
MKMLRTMKFISFAILIVLLLSYGELSIASELGNFDLVIENDYLALFLNRESTEIAVQNKESGETWYSNPPGDNRSNEQLIIHYFDPRDELKRMNNFRDSIEYGQFEFIEIENGIKIEYLIGEQWDDFDFVPQMMSADRFEDIVLEKVAARDERFLLNTYSQVMLVERENDEQAINLDNTRDDLFQKYTVGSPDEDLNDRARTDLARSLLNVILNSNDELDSREDITFEHISQLVDNPTYVLTARLRPWDEDDLVDLFRDTVGYMPEDKALDHEANNLSVPVENVEVFTIPIEYKLEGADFIVRVPMEEVIYPKDVLSQEVYVRGLSVSEDRGRDIIDKFGNIGSEEVTYTIHEIELLPFFGTATPEDEGYMFVPDGSGGLIYLDKETDQTYIKSLYGLDYTVADIPIEDTFVQNQTYREEIYLPVYGMKKNDEGFIAIIEEGDSIARVVARVSGRSNRYSRVYTRFLLNPRDNILLQEAERAERSGEKSINIYPESLPNENLQLRYTFLSDEDANYVGMARHYQNYLVDKHNLEQLASLEDIPFFLELVGAITVREPIMGFMRLISKELTTYQETEEIVEKLLAENINNIDLKYSGWLQNGIKHIYPNRVNLDSVLGTSNEFQDLISYLDNNSIDFYPEVGFKAIHDIRNHRNSYNYRRIAARRLNTEYAWYSDDWYTDRKWVLSTNLLDSLLDDFLSDYLDYDIGGIALTYMGHQINTTYRSNAEVDRPAAKNIVEEQLDKLRNYQQNIMVERANAYTLPYVNNITNFPMTSSTTNIIDREIPFYQMVVNSYVNYAGVPINLSEDLEFEFLKALETGSVPYFKWTYADSAMLLNTDFDYLYSSSYQIWFDRAVDYYHQANKVLSQVHNQRIINHQRVSENLYKTSYENGVSILVNYNDHSVTYADNVIEARSYFLTKEGNGNEK